MAKIRRHWRGGLRSLTSECHAGDSHSPPLVAPNALRSGLTDGLDLPKMLQIVFEAVGTLARKHVVEAKLRIYRQVIGRIYDQISDLDTFKATHDLLQVFQLGSFEVIIGQVKIAMSVDGEVDWHNVETRG